MPFEEAGSIPRDPFAIKLEGCESMAPRNMSMLLPAWCCMQLPNGMQGVQELLLHLAGLSKPGTPRGVGQCQHPRGITPSKMQLGPRPSLTKSSMHSPENPGSKQQQQGAAPPNSFMGSSSSRPCTSATGRCDGSLVVRERAALAVCRAVPAHSANSIPNHPRVPSPEGA